MYVREISEDNYSPSEYFYCDGYECSVDDKDLTTVFIGTKQEVANQCIAEFAKDENFLGYRIIETNITVNFEMMDQTLVIYLPDSKLNYYTN